MGRRLRQQCNTCIAPKPLHGKVFLVEKVREMPLT